MLLRAQVALPSDRQIRSTLADGPGRRHPRQIPRHLWDAADPSRASARATHGGQQKADPVDQARAGHQGPLGPKTRKKNLVNEATEEDLKKRNFIVDRPNALWLTDITEDPTREGKVYCVGCNPQAKAARYVGGIRLLAVETLR